LKPQSPKPQLYPHQGCSIDADLIFLKRQQSRMIKLVARWILYTMDRNSVLKKKDSSLKQTPYTLFREAPHQQFCKTAANKQATPQQKAQKQLWILRS